MAGLLRDAPLYRARVPDDGVPGKTPETPRLMPSLVDHD